MSAAEISKKLKTFAHSEFSGNEYSDIEKIRSKIDMKVDVVDMEAYAIAKVCKLEKIEFKCFK